MVHYHPKSEGYLQGVRVTTSDHWSQKYSEAEWQGTALSLSNDWQCGDGKYYSSLIPSLGNSEMRLTPVQGDQEKVMLRGLHHLAWPLPCLLCFLKTFLNLASGSSSQNPSFKWSRCWTQPWASGFKCFSFFWYLKCFCGHTDLLFINFTVI